jgi:hypothetical protein
MKQNSIAIVADHAQFPPAVFLAKKLAAMNRRGDTDIFLVSDSRRDLEVALQWGMDGCRVGEIQPMNITLKGAGHISGAAYYRLVLPRHLGGERMLYLDVDTFPDNAALFDLFDIDMQGHAIAAVHDLDVLCLGTPQQQQELREANRTSDRRYLNSGVLLIDVPRFIEQRIEARCFHEVITRSAHDQRALNIVLDGRWLPLAPSFNMTPLAYLCGVPKSYPPVISHFMGRAKPWHGALFYLDHPARQEIEAFIPRSPWPHFLDRNPPPEMVTINEWNPPAHVLAALRKHLSSVKFTSPVALI